MGSLLKLEMVIQLLWFRVWCISLEGGLEGEHSLLMMSMCWIWRVFNGDCVRRQEWHLGLATCIVRITYWSRYIYSEEGMAETIWTIYTVSTQKAYNGHMWTLLTTLCLERTIHQLWLRVFCLYLGDGMV